MSTGLLSGHPYKIFFQHGPKSNLTLGCLEVTFPPLRIPCAWIRFVEDQLQGETSCRRGILTGLMLHQPSPQIVRHADIEFSVLIASQNVDVRKTHRTSSYRAGRRRVKRPCTTRYARVQGTHPSLRPQSKTTLFARVHDRPIVACHEPERSEWFVAARLGLEPR